MAFLQYVDQPHYRGLILRRKSVDLDRADAILDRAKSWWLPTRRTGVEYFAGQRKFRFPSGATCEFNHCNNPGDEEENYQGGAWQFVGFDEATQFLPRQYLYLFSRLRRPEDAPAGLPDIPLRYRATANPGGPSHNFFRDRFMSLEYAKAFLLGKNEPVYSRQISFLVEIDQQEQTFAAVRSFVPSKMSDGAIDAATYIPGLAQLDPTDRERLLSGNWLINESGRLKPEWFRRYKLDSNGWIRLLDADGRIVRSIHIDNCGIFQTVDVAGTEQEFNKVVRKSAEPSYSVISTFIYLREIGAIAWLDVWREQVETPELMDAIKERRAKWKPENIYIERDGIGRTRLTRNIACAARAAPAANEAKEGRVYLPETAVWLNALEAELFSWRGSSDEQCDQIDTFAHAVQVKNGGFVGDVFVWGGDGN